MNNAERFRATFGMYATELWAMPEEKFVKWLNEEAYINKKLSRRVWMSRTKLSDKQIADIVMSIIGEIEPVGESHIDDQRFSNLLKLQNTMDILLDEIMYCLPYLDRVEYSMKRSAKQALEWMKEKRDWLQETIEDYSE